MFSVIGNANNFLFLHTIRLILGSLVPHVFLYVHLVGINSRNFISSVVRRRISLLVFREILIFSLYATYSLFTLIFAVTRADSRHGGV